VALALEMTAAKSVAFRLLSEFRLMPFPELIEEPDEPVELVEPLVGLLMVFELLLIFGWS
jgi:hypothetical protein